ncbi:MAG: hypothetical protein KDK45_08045, partial [Leptospiraceae bacterium]|nr:hypothetical protein [Leptospiraceae bacterium]
QVYEVLFDEKGSEIYLKPAKDFLEIGKEYSIYEVSNLVNQQSDLLIGYKKNSEEEYKDKRCGVVVNPPKSERITFTEVDKLIVISEVEYT